jgi:hypothetical protein
MNTELTPATNRHEPVRLKDGTRTSICIPKVMFDDLASKMEGGTVQLRRVIADLAREVEPRVGLSRSQAVRLALEAKCNTLCATA